MGSEAATRAIAHYDRLQSEASSRDSVMEQAYRYLLPSFEMFRTQQYFEQTSTTDHIYWTEPLEALKTGVSVCKYFTMPQDSIWMALVPQDEELAKNETVRRYLEEKTNLLFKMRYHALSGFQTESSIAWAQLLAGGNQAIMVRHRMDPVTRQRSGIAYRSEHAGRVYIDEDLSRNVIRKVRKLTMTAEAALIEWGKDLERSPKVMAAARDPKKKSDLFEFIHVIEPNPNVMAGRMDKWGKARHESYYSCDDKEAIVDGGTNTHGIIYSRFERNPNSKYGNGPGITKLPDIKEGNQIAVDIAVANELTTVPGWGAFADVQDQLLNIEPNGISYGTLNSRGEPMVRPIFTGGDTSGAEAQLQRLGQGIDRAFFGNILQLNEELKSHITATERLQRREEVGVVLDPLALQQTEWFAPMADDEVVIMAEQGLFDDMPGELREAGGAFALQYDNPLSRAQKSARAAGWFRLKGEVTEMAAVYPEALDVLQREFPLEKVLVMVADALDVPQSVRATEEEKAAYDEKRANDKAQQSALATLPAVAGGVKDLAQAASYANAA